MMIEPDKEPGIPAFLCLTKEQRKAAWVGFKPRTNTEQIQIRTGPGSIAAKLGYYNEADALAIQAYDEKAKEIKLMKEAAAVSNQYRFYDDKQKEAAEKKAREEEIRVLHGIPPKRRGRPKGSKNKAKGKGSVTRRAKTY